MKLAQLSENISSNKKYYARYCFELPAQYVWPESIYKLTAQKNYPTSAVSDLPVSVNGNIANDAYITFLSYYKNDSVDISIPVEKPNVSNAEVTNIFDKTYDKHEQTQEPVVCLNGKTLIYGIDYDISYKNNINAGNAYVVITGKGSYTGTLEVPFKIAKASQSIYAEDITMKYGDKPVRINASTDGDGELSYDVTDKNVVSVNSKGTVTIKDGGKTKIKITAAATANYKSATKTINVTVKMPENRKKIDAANVTGIKNKTYTGKEIKQKPILTLGGEKLVENTDYIVEYRNNTNVGSATMIITGKGYYKGSITRNFKINKAKVKITAKTISAKASKLKKKAQSFKKSKAFKITGSKGKVTFKKTKGNSKITVSKSGKVTLKKGLKKGNYKVKVKITAKGDKNHNNTTKTVTLNVKIKK